MGSILLSILNMSMTASFVILAVCAARLLLKKAPKIISYALWAVVAFRLIVPFSFEGVFSLMPINPNPIPQDIVYKAAPQIDTGLNTFDNAVNASLPAPAQDLISSINPLQVWLAIGEIIWLIGIAVMLIYSFITIYLLKRRLKSAVLANDNIYEADDLKTPFVLGYIKPKIYIPAGLKPEEKDYIILHEQTHIRRKDHIVKLFAYLVLCLHWFNPFVWVAFMLMDADMELSCDERVLKELGSGIKKDYSASLLSFSTGRRIINGSPLAFGEGGVKNRIKNVLNFKKPSRVIIIVAVILAATISIGFAADKKSNISLAEFEVLYSDVTDYSYSVSFKYDGYIYSPYIVNEEIQMAGDLRGAKEIGFAIGEKDDKYQIYERTGYSIYNFISVQDDGIMNPATIYIASATPDAKRPELADIEKIQIGMTIDEVHNILGEPHGMLSGLFGEFYELVDGKQATIYYNENKTINILITGNKGEESIFFRTASDKYRPDFISISAQLMNIDRETTLNCGNAFSILKLVGNDSWELVPFKDDIGFDGIQVTLEYGDSQSFNLMPEMLTAKLGEGQYRFETNVWYGVEPIIHQIVWAEFSIDKDAEQQTTFTQPKNWFATTDGKDMTLDDVRSLANKGDSLMLDDIMGFNGVNLSSGYDQLRLIAVDDSYVLTVRSPADAKPNSVILNMIGNTFSEGIDIRYNDLDVFIYDHPIHMTLKEGSLSATGATFILKNLTDKDYIYENYYVLQNKTDNGWEDIEPIIENYGFTQEGLRLQNGENKEVVIDWEWLYGTLSPGDYRIYKEALYKTSFDENDTYSLYAAFTISN